MRRPFSTILLYALSLAVGFASLVLQPAILVSAAPRPGTPVGSIYYSDIKAYIDDRPINSYNIGGKTAIICEDLRSYGFTVSWAPKARVLEVKTASIDDIQGLSPEPRQDGAAHRLSGRPGARAGTIFATDIVTYFNGHVVPSYNIGGRTVVAIEDLGNMARSRPLDEASYSDCGFSYNWNPVERAITLYPLRPGQTVSGDLGELRVSGIISPGSLGWLSGKTPLRLDGEVLRNEISVVTLPIGHFYMPVSDLLSSLGVKWEWQEEKSLLIMASRSLSPADSGLEEVITPEEYSFRNVCGIKMNMEVGGQAVQIPSHGGSYVPSDAVLVGGKTYIRCKVLALALDLVFVPNDGFYQKKDTPVVWDHTFMPFAGQINDWLVSSTPSYFSAGRDRIGISPYDVSQPIRLVFAKEMREETLNKDTVTVFWKDTQPDGRVKYGIISDSYNYSYDKAQKTLVLTPLGSSGFFDLSPGLEVMVAVKPQVADVKGNHPTQGIKIGFTVAK